MTEAVFQYKCRHCGERYDGGVTGSQRGLQCLLQALKGKGDRTTIPPLHDIHYCETAVERVGIADLVGYRTRGEGDD